MLIRPLLTYRVHRWGWHRRHTSYLQGELTARRSSDRPSDLLNQVFQRKSKEFQVVQQGSLRIVERVSDLRCCVPRSPF